MFTFLLIKKFTNLIMYEFLYCSRKRIMKIQYKFINSNFNKEFKQLINFAVKCYNP